MMKNLDALVNQLNAKAQYDFARWCALQVLHLWSAIPDVVRRYLDGDDSLRELAFKAADQELVRMAQGDWVDTEVDAAEAARDAARRNSRQAALESAYEMASAMAYAAGESSQARQRALARTRQLQIRKLEQMIK